MSQRLKKRASAVYAQIGTALTIKDGGNQDVLKALIFVQVTRHKDKKPQSMGDPSLVADAKSP
jgi:hypothetical protein